MSVQNAKKKSLIEPLVVTAAVSGIFQGFFWFLLSLGAILFYEEIFEVYVGKDVIGLAIFNIYLDKSASVESYNKGLGISLIIGPKEFNYFMYIYLILSFGLLVISLVILWASITKKSERFHKLRICLWTSVFTMLSLLDLILTCLIGHDYGQAKYLLYQMQGQTEPSILVAIGIVMTLAARGFLLWIINVIFIAILGKHYNNLRKKECSQIQTRPALDAFSSGMRPPWDQSLSPYADPNTFGQQNKGFRDDDNNPMFSSFPQSPAHVSSNNRDNYDHRDRGNNREVSPYGQLGGQNISGIHNNNWDKSKRQQGMGGNYPLRPYSHQSERPMESPNQWGQQAPLRTAKIGRQGGQSSPPLNVSTPYIPNPDYSPPGSPRVRGVLRPKSNYAMY